MGLFSDFPDEEVFHTAAHGRVNSKHVLGYKQRDRNTRVIVIIISSPYPGRLRKNEMIALNYSKL